MANEVLAKVVRHNILLRAECAVVEQIGSISLENRAA
jgi:hypothetical protein